MNKRRSPKPEKPAHPSTSRPVSWHFLLVLLCATVAVCWACSEMLLLMQPACISQPDQANLAERAKGLEQQMEKAIQELSAERRLRTEKEALATALEKRLSEAMKSLERERVHMRSAQACCTARSKEGFEANLESVQLMADQQQRELQQAVAPTSADFQGVLVRSLQAEVADLRARLGQPQSAAAAPLPQSAPPAAVQPAAPTADAPPATPPERSLRGSPAADLAPVGVGGVLEEALVAAAARGATAVVVISCRRLQYLQRTMDALLAAPRDASLFPIVISQDAFDNDMSQMISDKFVTPGIAFHMHHAREANAPEVAKQFKGSLKVATGYVRIAQHYGFALKIMFDDVGFQQIIFVEEDMEVAPDFFSYFQSMLPILKSDPQLFCVSAWNDNGDSSLVMDHKAAFRTDFFPGLGWMLQKDLWNEIRDRWAVSYWDEFIRRSDVRKGRHCIRPEVSRTFTFGEKGGASAGQFFKKHLSRIKLNDQRVDWGSLDLSFLSSPSAFDSWLEEQLRAAAPTRLESVDSAAGGARPLRIAYDDKDYAKRVAKSFGLMEDEKEGVRRTSYRGVILFAWKGTRIFLHTRQWPAGLDS